MFTQCVCPSGIVKEGASSGGWLKEHIRSCENSILSLTGGKHRTQELKLDVESSRVCVLLSGPPEYDTLMSFSTGWRGRKQTKEDNAVDSDSESDSENEDPPPNDGDLHDMDEDQIKSDLLGAFWRQDRYVCERREHFLLMSETRERSSHISFTS